MCARILSEHYAVLSLHSIVVCIFQIWWINLCGAAACLDTTFFFPKKKFSWGSHIKLSYILTRILYDIYLISFIKERNSGLPGKRTLIYKTKVAEKLTKLTFRIYYMKNVARIATALHQMLVVHFSHLNETYTLQELKIY